MWREHTAGAVPHEPIKRPVVLLKVQMGDQIRTIKVNLTNRKRFIYPLLLVEMLLLHLMEQLILP